MAIEEHDREDLLRDGRTMSLRGQCSIGGEVVVVGFRPNGQVSLYCGSDPVFQFNIHDQLRRVYFLGRRYAAESGVLVELAQETRGGKVQFVSTPIDAATQAAIAASLRDWLQKIRQAVKSTNEKWQAIEGEPNEFQDRLSKWLQQCPAQPSIADAPNV